MPQRGARTPSLQAQTHSQQCQLPPTFSLSTRFPHIVFSRSGITPFTQDKTEFQRSHETFCSHTASDDEPGLCRSLPLGSSFPPYPLSAGLTDCRLLDMCANEAWWLELHWTECLWVVQCPLDDSLHKTQTYNYTQACRSCPSLKAAPQDPYPRGSLYLDLDCHPVLKTSLNSREKA